MKKKQNRTEKIILRTWFVETGSEGEEKEKEVEDIWFDPGLLTVFVCVLLRALFVYFIYIYIYKYFVGR